MDGPDARSKIVLADGTILHATGSRLRGELNNNHIFCDSTGRLYVYRTRNYNPKVLREIRQELSATYFVRQGGSYRIRTLEQQALFMNEAMRLSLNVVTPIAHGSSWILLPFVEGVSYDKYLRRGWLDATSRVLDHLRAAHRLAIVFGDRWTRNTIITPDGNVVEIDFDIELQGDGAAEFELAQTLYHVVFFSSDRMAALRYIRSYFKSHDFRAAYRWRDVIMNLSSYVSYFRDREYQGIAGGIQEEVRVLNVILQDTSIAE